jgi:hypothetical protein
MEHVNPLPFLNNTKYDTIDVRLVAVEEMAELRFLRCHGGSGLAVLPGGEQPP